MFGAIGPDSYDCSGLVMKAWAAAGVSIPRTTYYQATTGVAVTSLAEMQPGDLILIPGSDGTMAHPGHVGIYIGRDSSGRQWLVQAPHTGTRRAHNPGQQLVLRDRGHPPAANSRITRWPTR